ncbi:MAG TPA: T9SS type A sorting domain-containing protein, partial [Chitinophagales bacterium]|nr:T9SS type A sorting domain-containing protein [Chitinophagales bacterium]
VYEWQKLENGTWIGLGNTSSNQLNLNNLTSSDNGQYRISLKRYNPENTSGTYCGFSSSGVNINVLSPPLVNINVPDNGILCLGESFNLSTNINDGNWVIDNDQIISINSNGQVIGKSVGVAQITYTVPENETTCQASASSQIMVGSCTVLPIELLSFNAICLENRTITLNWSTASETNSAYFTLEKSSDAIDFYSIGTISAAGKSSSELQYQYIDKEINGDNYYRLKLTNLDGSESVYNIINIKCNPTQNQINAYYTRNNQIEIEIISNNTTNYIFNLFQANGKQLYNGGIVTNANKTTFKITPEEHLVQGVYLLQIINNDQIETKKIWIAG